MPFTMRCPGCDSRFEFTSDLEGKRIKCKNCGDEFRVERPIRKSRDDDRQPSRSRREVNDDDHRLGRKRRSFPDEYDEPRRRGKDAERKKIHPLLIIGPIAGVGLIALVTIVLLVVTRDEAKPTTPTVDAGAIIKAPSKSCPIDVPETQAGFLVLPDAGGGFGLLRKKDPNPAKKDWLFEPYDLSAGRRLGRVELTKIEEPIAWTLSPDSKHLLITESKSRGLSGDHRLHLISTADGKDVDWQPFPRDPKRAARDAPALFCAELVANDRILAIGTNRRIYMYRLSDLQNPDLMPSFGVVGDPLGKAFGGRIDDIDRIQWQVAFTADRKRLAIWNGDGYSFLDTTDCQESFRTPSTAGALKELWPRQSIRRETLRAGPVAFSPDGSTLAGVVSTDFGDRQHALCLWDTSESKPPTTYDLPSHQFNDATTLRWWGKKYVLLSGGKVFGKDIEGMLVDTRTGHPIRQLMGPEFNRYGLGRDGRLWYAASPDRKESATIHVFEGLDNELNEDAGRQYEEISELRDSFLRRLWMEPNGVLRRPTRPNPQLQQGLIRRP